MDLPVLRYAKAVNGLDSLIITKLDILDTLDEIPICVAYEYDGAVEHMPPQAEMVEKVRPVYRTFPGWKQSTFGLTRYDELPQKARHYLEYISGELGLEISLIATGPEREQSIIRPGTRLQQLLPSPFFA